MPQNEGGENGSSYLSSFIEGGIGNAAEVKIPASTKPVM